MWWFGRDQRSVYNPSTGSNVGSSFSQCDRSLGSFCSSIHPPASDPREQQTLASFLVIRQHASLSLSENGTTSRMTHPQSMNIGDVVKVASFGDSLGVILPSDDAKKSKKNIRVVFVSGEEMIVESSELRPPSNGQYLLPSNYPIALTGPKGRSIEAPSFSPAHSIEPANLPSFVATVHGLKSSAQHNGRRVLLVNWIQSKQRYSVRLLSGDDAAADSSSTTLSIRPQVKNFGAHHCRTGRFCQTPLRAPLDRIETMSRPRGDSAHQEGRANLSRVAGLRNRRRRAWWIDGKGRGSGSECAEARRDARTNEKMSHVQRDPREGQSQEFAPVY